MYHNLMHLLLKCSAFLLSLPSEWLPDVPCRSSYLSGALTHHCRDAPDLTTNLPSTLPQGFVPHTTSPLSGIYYLESLFDSFFPSCPWHLVAKYYPTIIFTESFSLRRRHITVFSFRPRPSYFRSYFWLKQSTSNILLPQFFCGTTWATVPHSSVFAYKPSGQMKL